MATPSTKMLIVEDEGLIALDLEGKLKQSGYAVTSLADSSTTALAAIERQRPDLVLMDISLKGAEDGILAAEKIRGKYDLPIIFVSAHADAGTLERARLTEPYGFIVKPFAGVNFRAQIEMALWKHSTQREVRQREASLSSAFKSLPEALLVTNARGNVILMNSHAAELTGWDFAQAEGKPLLQVLRICAGKEWRSLVDLIGSPGNTSAVTCRLVTRSGSSIPIEAAFARSRDGRGSLCGIVVVFRDITERREAEDRERQIQKAHAITLMAAGLARELGETRKQLDGPLNDLLRNASGWELRKLGDVYGAASYPHLLLEQLAALSRTEPDPRSPIDLNKTLLAMKKALHRSLGRSRSLGLHLEASLPPIMIDPNGLRKNLLRLAAEAGEAMPDGGNLDLTTRIVVCPNGEECVELSVSDTGQAVKEGASERVFEPYYQSRPGNRNSGLALALVYHFVALNGGSIDVESPAEGARFLIRFPAADRFLSAGAKTNPMELTPVAGEPPAWRVHAG